MDHHHIISSKKNELNINNNNDNNTIKKNGLFFFKNIKLMKRIDEEALTACPSPYVTFFVDQWDSRIHAGRTRSNNIIQKVLFLKYVFRLWCKRAHWQMLPVLARLCCLHVNCG